jgi:hypothetical protein
MRFTKSQVKRAFYLFMDFALPKCECEIVAKEGNWRCKRCDDCVFEQYINKAKAGELCRQEREVKKCEQR